MADPSTVVHVAVDDRRVVGFAAVGPELAGDDPGFGQLYSIYLLAELVGHGVGHRLHTHCMSALVAAGFAGAIVWVLDTNARAIAFYERGGLAVRRADQDRGARARSAPRAADQPDVVRSLDRLRGSSPVRAEPVEASSTRRLSRPPARDSDHGGAPARRRRSGRSRRGHTGRGRPGDQPRVDPVSVRLHPQPARGPGQHRPPGRIRPLGQPERATRSRRLAGEGVRQLLVAGPQQADRHPAGPLGQLGEVGLLVDEAQHLRGLPSATSSEDTVQPARRSPSCAHQRLTGCGIRPRNRRSGSRSPSGVRNGCSRWMLTSEVCPL